MGTAAIYARKSTEQTGVADEQKSVSRQIAHARQYAERKGWTVDESLVFVDDGISGAEFANRPGFLRLMNALKPRPAFNVLIMSEESRLGREAIETAYALKQLVQAGVRVFFYLEDRERTLDSPTDKIMLSLTAFADELEREKARQRTYDAMLRKAKAGHVTGGRVFGYDNVEVQGPDGKRSHVTRRINEAEAVIVRRIFELCASGTGYTRIAKLLNAEGAPSPRPQQGRPAGWAPTSIHEVLKRPLYRGEIRWNQTRKRDRWGRTDASARPEADWISIPAPELRIISDALWTAATARLTGIRAKLAATGAGFRRAPRDADSRYLLPGFARCGVCGGGFGVVSRSHGGRRAYFYACVASWKRGRSVCANSEIIAMDRADDAVLQALGGDVLRPAVVSAVLEGVLEAIKPAARAGAIDRHREELATIEREIGRLTAAIAAGGELTPLLDALKARQSRQNELQRTIGSAKREQAPRVNRAAVESHVRARVTRWRELLTRQVADGRQLLREVLNGPIRFLPVEGQRRTYRFDGQAELGRLFAGLALPTSVASPTGFEPVFWP